MCYVIFLICLRCSYDFLEIIDSPHDIADKGQLNVAEMELSPFREHKLINKSFIFDLFLDIYKGHDNYFILNPHNKDFPETFTNSNLPKRICGDWNSKLKLLRYQSQGSILGLHFLSDYSHHFGGYKAKISVKNGKIYTIRT